MAEQTFLSRGRSKLPAGATDCHSHIVGPAAAWAMVGSRKYEPEEGLVDEYINVIGQLGVERSILVQPSFYGTDNGCQIEAMRVIGRANSRGVAVVGEDVEAGELRRLHHAGIRGVRINLMSGGLALQSLEPIAHKIAPFNWHIQIFASSIAIAAIEARLRSLPVPVVIDHMGCPERGRGISQSGFQVLLRLLNDRVVWVKLAGAERLSVQAGGFDDVVPFAQALISAAPERVIWGLDWPPSRYFATPPAPGDWIDLLFKYTSDPCQLKSILVDNPAKLYDFEHVEEADLKALTGS
jgi:predicted TIM-barrel fold metal-dependent hydrolase